MALRNSKSGFYTIHGEAAPKSFEEEMIVHCIQSFKERRWSEGLSVLLFYVISKADQVGVETELNDKFEELVDFIHETGEAAEVLLRQFPCKEELTQMDLKKMRHLQHICVISESFSSFVGPRQFEPGEFIAWECPFFLSELFKVKQHLKGAGIDEDLFTSYLQELVLELENLAGMFKRWVDLTAVETEALEELYQLTVFSKLVEMARSGVAQVVDKGNLRDWDCAPLPEDYHLLLSLEFKELLSVETVEAMKRMDSIDDHSPF